MSLRFFRKFRVFLARNSAYDNGRLVAIQTKAPSIYHQIFITRFVLTSYRNNPFSKHFAHCDTSSLSNSEGLLPSTETTNEKFCLTYRYFDFSAICLTGCTLSTTKEGTNKKSFRVKWIMEWILDGSNNKETWKKFEQERERIHYSC